MRHGNINRKFGREHKHRMAMLRNQVTSLLQHERLTTTIYKAKEIRGIAEKVITLGKKGDLHSRRIAFKTVRDHEVLAKVFGPLAERFATRPGGYIRILKVGLRHGDMAPLSIIELLPDPNAKAASTDDAPKKAVKAKAPKAEKAAKAEGDEAPAKEAKAKKAPAAKKAKADGEEPKAKATKKKKG